ncbi:MAG: hypothetical protein R6X32_24120 [Chloroflexota bacterium]
MKKQKLLVYQWLSQRYRGLLLWLWVVLLILAVYDFTTRPLFGAAVWPMVWVAFGASFLLWLYYALLLQRAAVILQPRVLLVRGPVRSMRISYGRITTITSTQLIRHHDYKQLKGPERVLVEAVGGQTCLYIELSSYPKQYKHRRLWYSRFLFSMMRPGLLLVVEDWMTLSRQLEGARLQWHDSNKAQHREDKRSLAARVLDEKGRK